MPFLFVCYGSALTFSVTFRTAQYTTYLTIYIYMLMDAIVYYAYK